MKRSSTALSVALAVIVASGGCFIGDSEDDPGLPEWTPTWQAELRGERVTIEPGEWLSFDLTQTDVPPEEIILWLENGSAVPLLDFRLLDPGDDLESSLDDELVVNHIQPYIRPGLHAVVLGTRDGPRSNLVEFEVSVPTPAYTREEVAETIWHGLDGMTLGLREYAGDGPVADFVNDYHGEAGRNAIREHMPPLMDVTQIAGESYLEVEDEDEAGLQAMLVNTGLLATFQDASVVSPTSSRVPLSRRPGILEAALGARPVHSILYELDFTSMSISVALKTADAVAIALIATGVGAPSGVAVEVVKLSLAFIAAFIESVIPTDVVAAELQSQDVFVDGVPSPHAVWGTFTPQKPMIDGANWTVSTVLAKISTTLLRKALPVKLTIAEQLAKKALDKVIGALVKHGVTGAFNTFFPPGVIDAKSFQVKVLLDMRIYDLTMFDLLGLMPWAKQALGKVAKDDILWKSVDVDSFAPAFAGSTKTTLTDKTLTLQGATWPAQENTASVGINNKIYSWETTAIELLQGIDWAINEFDVDVFILKKFVVPDVVKGASDFVDTLVVYGFAKKNPFKEAGGWLLEQQRAVRSLVVNGILVRPTLRFVEVGHSPILLKTLETRAGDWAYLGHQHRAEYEWHVLEGIRYPVVVGGDFVHGRVMGWAPDTTEVEFRASLANPAAKAVTIRIWAGKDVGSLLPIDTIVVGQSTQFVTFNLASGKNVIRVEGLVAENTAMVFDIADLSGHDIKHTKIDVGTMFDYKVYAPPAPGL
jgi:hypothetical protein